MKSILVTGCNRGIGLGLIKHLVKLKNPPRNIIATCRNIDKAKDLQQITGDNKSVHLLELDVKEVDQYEQFFCKVQNIVKDDGLNVLINNAGVSTKFARIQLVKEDQLVEAFKVNAVAPILLTKALLPLLKQAASVNSTKPLGSEKALVVNISTFLASISLNNDGGLYPYRCSKAALNMATKSMSVDLKKDQILVTAIHPGWVKTDMGGKNAPLEVETSTSSILDFMQNINETHNGGFYQYDGAALNW